MPVDLPDLIRQLEQDPAVRAQVRAVILSDDLLSVPAAVARLAEAQARTEAAVVELVERQDRLEASFSALRSEVGKLSQIVGGTVEEDAASLVETVLTDRGWTILSPPAAMELNGELDVCARAEDEAGNPVFVLAEAKVRLRPADIRRFAASLPGLLGAAGASGDHLAYVYGFRVYAGSISAAEELGVGILSPAGEQVEPRRSA